MVSRSKVTLAGVQGKVLGLYGGLGRPVHLADIAGSFNVLEKRDSKRRKNGDGSANQLSRALRRLFYAGRVSRSRGMVRVAGYPASPYAAVDSVTTNVYFYGPMDLAGENASFPIDGQSFDVSFVSQDMLNGEDSVITKKEMALGFLRASDRALTVNELLEKINGKYKAYEVSGKKDFYNATSSLTRAVLKPLRREGLRGLKLDNKWVWYFTDEQLSNYRDYYVRSDPVLCLVEDLVRSEKCVALNRILSELQLTPGEAKYRISRVAKYVPVKINVASTTSSTKVDLEVGEFKRDSFLPWLGMAVPRSDSGYGYETMLVYLDSDWEEELRRQVKKSLTRIHVRTVMGRLYEKLVARLFDVLCTSKELQSSAELSRYMIPFVFRDEKVSNVWYTTEGGRRGEFDVLLRGTFVAFDAMSEGKNYLDLVVPIESKYTMVKPEHVTTFDDKIRRVFGERGKVIPILVGMAWTEESLHVARRFGILTVYFSAIDKLIRKMTGHKYRHEHEWRRIEEEMNQGRLTLEELRAKLDDGSYVFLFEEYLREALNGTGGI